MLQAFLPLLRGDIAKGEQRGRIINMSSVYGSYGMAFQGPYCASKAALEGISDALRQEMRVYGIHVVTVRPGQEIELHVLHGFMSQFLCHLPRRQSISDAARD